MRGTLFLSFNVESSIMSEYKIPKKTIFIDYKVDDNFLHTLIEDRIVYKAGMLV